MILGIATVVVLVLVAVALLPTKKRDRDGNNLNFTQPFVRPTNFRQQQLNEEAEAFEKFKETLEAETGFSGLSHTAVIKWLINNNKLTE